MEPLISIQILNWNRAHETLRAIKSAKNQSYKNIEIVVVDNGSTDESINLIKLNYPDIKLLELNKNYGCPGGRNLGIKICEGEYIFYLDNDGVLHKNAVSNALLAFQNDQNIGIVTGKVYDFEEETEIDVNCIPLSNNGYLSWEFQGGISLHKKKIYDEIGYYPDHFMYGGEEHFLTLKMFNANYSIYKDETVILWHKKSNIARNKEIEILRSYYNKLYTSICLYPSLEATQFFFFFLFVYPIHAWKTNVFSIFLKNMKVDFIPTINLALKNRHPVTRKAYHRLMKCKKSLKFKIRF